MYEEIARQLNECEMNQVIDTYKKGTIADMSKKVLEYLASKYSNVKKEVGAIMGGEILEYPTKTAWREGMQQGKQEGMQQGMQQGKLAKLTEIVQKKLQKGCSVAQIAELLEEDLELIQSITDNLQNAKEEA